MTDTFDWAGLLATAEEAGVTTKELPVGKYPVAEVTHISVKDTQGKVKGKRVGLRFKVIGGPEDGGAEWANINVPKPGDKPGASAAFVRTISKLGVQPSGDLEEAFEKILGNRYSIQVKRDRADNNGGFWTDVLIGARVASETDDDEAPAPVTVPAAPVESSLDDEDFEDRPV